MSYPKAEYFSSDKTPTKGETKMFLKWVRWCIKKHVDEKYTPGFADPCMEQIHKSSFITDEICKMMKLSVAPAKIKPIFDRYLLVMYSGATLPSTPALLQSRGVIRDCGSSRIESTLFKIEDYEQYLDLIGGLKGYLIVTIGPKNYEKAYKIICYLKNRGWNIHISINDCNDELIHLIKNHFDQTCK